MKKVTLLVVVVSALLVLTAGSIFAQETVTATLTEQNGSGQNGAVALAAVDADTTAVAIDISGGTETPQPAHIHKGTCANLDPKPAFPLTSVVNGRSSTIVEASIAELTNGTYAVNVHRSAAEASVYVSCGELMALTTTGGPTTVGMPRTGSSNLLVLGGLALLAATTVGAGITLARRKA